jgi:hypothetical protein
MTGAGVEQVRLELIAMLTEVRPVARKTITAKTVDPVVVVVV